MDIFQKLKSNINIETSIVSLYILKEIFSFLSEKQKLDVIIYNKQLQKKLEVNIEDYKRISGVYKIGGKNGKGKEYTLQNNYMIFEGKYLNGKRNGKEYNIFGNIEYEGEYLNGERNGKGKTYNLFRRSLFKWNKKWKRKRIFL